ncbi:MAG: SCO family protein [Terriglobia bacterium]
MKARTNLRRFSLGCRKTAAWRQRPVGALTIALAAAALVLGSGAAGYGQGIKGALSGLKSLSTVAPRGECKMAPDTTKGRLANSKQVPTLLRGVGIDQRLNQQIPLDLVFRDASGKEVRLRDYFGQKPVILALVYFNCPNLCTMVVDNLVQSLRLLKFDVGKQFNVLTVSFDPNDTPQMATDKRAIYLGMYARKGCQNGWHFLTGDETSIRALTDAVGYHYNYDPTTKLYAHAVGLVVLTPQGKVSRYFYGLRYPAGDLRLALVEASHEKIGSPVDRLILYCCSYDPATGKYDPIISRVLMLGGIFTVLCLGTLVLVMVRGGNQPPPPPAA